MRTDGLSFRAIAQQLQADRYYDEHPESIGVVSDEELRKLQDPESF